MLLETFKYYSKSPSKAQYEGFAPLTYVSVWGLLETQSRGHLVAFYWRGIVHSSSFMHKGFSSSNLYSQALCLPGQVEERRFPVRLHQHHFQNNSLQQKKASHTDTALLLCPRLILSQQFLSLTQHGSIFTTTKCICSKSSMYNIACPIPVVLPLLILIYPLLLLLSHTHRQPPVAESMGVTCGNLTTIWEYLTNIGFNIPKATIVKGNHYLSTSDRSPKVIEAKKKACGTF